MCQVCQIIKDECNGGSTASSTAHTVEAVHGELITAQHTVLSFITLNRYILCCLLVVPARVWTSQCLSIALTVAIGGVCAYFCGPMFVIVVLNHG